MNIIFIQLLSDLFLTYTISSLSSYPSKSKSDKHSSCSIQQFGLPQQNHISFCLIWFYFIGVAISITSRGLTVLRMVFGSCCLQQKISSLKYLKTSLACNLGRLKKKLFLQLCTYVSLCSHSSSSRCSYHISSPSPLNYSGCHLLQCPLLGLVLLQATEEET